MRFGPEKGNFFSARLNSDQKVGIGDFFKNDIHPGKGCSGWLAKSFSKQKKKLKNSPEPGIENSQKISGYGGLKIKKQAIVC
jgi:hypothetical protein